MSLARRYRLGLSDGSRHALPGMDSDLQPVVSGFPVSAHVYVVADQYPVGMDHVDFQSSVAVRELRWQFDS